MATESEIEFFSVTPLDDGAEGGGAAGAGGRPAATATTRPLKASLMHAAAWVVAAALAVGASFAPLYRIHGQLSDQAQLSGNPAATRFSFYVDGWGRPRLRASGPLSVDDALTGPRYGIVFCACAALMLVAAVVAIAGPRILAALRPRWRASSTRPVMPTAQLSATVGITGALLLAGSAGSVALSTLPIRKQVLALDYETFGLGWSIGLAALSSLVCVLAWGWDRLTTARASAASAAEVVPDADETEPVAGNPMQPAVPEPDASAWRPPVDRLE